jgi:hypothetical protein
VVALAAQNKQQPQRAGEIIAGAVNDAEPHIQRRDTMCN